MSRPVLPLILLLAGCILIFFLLNLLLGSVHIPSGSVWNILWDTGDEPVVWQNIIRKSRVPQAVISLVAGAGMENADEIGQNKFRLHGHALVKRFPAHVAIDDPFVADQRFIPFLIYRIVTRTDFLHYRLIFCRANLFQR